MPLPAWTIFFIPQTPPYAPKQLDPAIAAQLAPYQFAGTCLLVAAITTLSALLWILPRSVRPSRIAIFVLTCTALEIAIWSGPGLVRVLSHYGYSLHMWPASYNIELVPQLLPITCSAATEIEGAPNRPCDWETWFKGWTHPGNTENIYYEFAVLQCFVATCMQLALAVLVLELWYHPIPMLNRTHRQGCGRCQVDDMCIDIGSDKNLTRKDKDEKKRELYAAKREGRLQEVIAAERGWKDLGLTEKGG